MVNSYYLYSVIKTKTYKVMKNLSVLSDEELLREFNNFNNFYEAQFSIDYGEFSGGYPEEYFDIYEKFEEEFETRGINDETVEEFCLLEAAYLAGFEPSSDTITASQEIEEATKFLIEKDLIS